MIRNVAKAGVECVSQQIVLLLPLLLLLLLLHVACCRYMTGNSKHVRYAMCPGVLGSSTHPLPSLGPTTFIEQTALITLKIVNTLCQPGVIGDRRQLQQQQQTAVHVATNVAVCYSS